jgi:nitrogen fixation protein NifU and related proteins
MEGVVSEGILKNIKFSSKGCVLSQATASMLTEKCKNKEINEILALSSEDVLKMIGLALGPNRLKCALLPLMVLKKGLQEYHDTKYKNTKCKISKIK